MLLMRNISIASAIFFLVSFLMLASEVVAAPITFQAGLNDSFAAGPDPAFPSTELVTKINDFGATTTNFDGLPHNQSVAHTFVGLPTDLVAGSLEFRVRGGTPPGVDTDGIAISFVDSDTIAWPDDVVWGRTFGVFAGGGTLFADPDPGLITPGVAWAPGAEALVTLDLTALPLADGNTLNLIPLLNQHGFVDITVSDDSVADFYRLNVAPVPIPGSVFLLASSLLGVLSLRRIKLR